MKTSNTKRVTVEAYGYVTEHGTLTKFAMPFRDYEQFRKAAIATTPEMVKYQYGEKWKQVKVTITYTLPHKKQKK